MFAVTLLFGSLCLASSAVDAMVVDSALFSFSANCTFHFFIRLISFGWFVCQVNNCILANFIFGVRLLLFILVE